MLHSYLQYKCIQHNVTQLSTIQMYTHSYVYNTNVYNIMLHSYLQYKCIQHNVTQLSTIQMYTT